MRLAAQEVAEEARAAEEAAGWHPQFRRRHSSQMV